MSTSRPADLRVFTHPRCLDHVAPPGFPERPERLRGILDRLRSEGLSIDDTPGNAEAVDRAIAAVHDADYVARFRRAVERGDGLLDSADNPLSSATWDAAHGAVDAGLRAVDWLIGAAEGSASRRAFVAVRPPGHHAEFDHAMGFCYFGTVAIAAHYLIEAHGLERVAIVDFDVHHGNGTQHLLETRADIFFASLHQFPFYPGTGASSERGRGDGEGATLNVPLAAGTGDEEWLAAFDDAVLPALRDFSPEALLVSAGFDAWRGDPLGGTQVSEEGFAAFGARLAGLADDLCSGRLAAFLEGGYDIARLPDLVLGHLRAWDDS